MKTIETYKGIEIKFGYNGAKSRSVNSKSGRTYYNKNSSYTYIIDGEEYGFSASYTLKPDEDCLKIAKEEIDSILLLNKRKKLPWM